MSNLLQNPTATLEAFKSLLRGFHHPEQLPQLPSIPSVLPEAGLVARQLSRQIQSLEDARTREMQNLTDLRAQKLQMDELGEVCRALLPPIRRLNTDVLCLVFELLCDGDIAVYSALKFLTLDPLPQFEIGSVCAQ